jgi:hypothetical protein
MPLNYLKKSISSIDLNLLVLNKEQFQIILVSHVIWWLIYLAFHFFINLSLKKRKLIHDTKTRFVSIIHATLIFWLAMYDTLFNQNDKCGETNTPFQNFIMLISLSYFLYDLIACIALDVSDREMVLHHLFVMVGYYIGVSYNNSANEMVRALIITEISCPIMHLRMILKNYDLKHTKAHCLLDFIYMIIYILARVIYGTKITIFTVFCRDNLLLVKVAGIFIWVQSILFARRMISLIRHRYLEYKERTEKDVELYWLTHNKKIEELEYFKRSLKRATYVP